MTTLSIGRCGVERKPRAGFTLIELILVMSLLAVVISVSLPALKGFFRGRNLDSEARRMMTLTRYAQSRAASEGMPMVLWVDVNEKRYGMRAADGYMETDSRAVEYELAEGIDIEVAENQAATSMTSMRAQGTEDAHVIEFRPDGFVNESSLEWILLQQGEDSVWITQSTNRLYYEIQRDHAGQPVTTGRVQR